MANPEHLQVLKQGVEVWNKWRAESRETIPDLRHADLYGADLITADFKGANLEGASLKRTNLTMANLEGASLKEANLEGANLTVANLERANLNGARLLNVTFNITRLNGADFTNALLCFSQFGNTDLSKVRGLEKVNHVDQSTVGIDTIYSSHGNIPEVFLRGCGVPESFIVQMHALVASTEAIQFYSCFISYSSKDQDFANRLYGDLQNTGVRCWFAPEDLKIGDRIRDRIDESIKLRDKLLLILSESSIASDWVEHEVESALEEERRTGRTVLFPIRVEDSVFACDKAWAALIRRTRHVGDFTGWKDHDSYQKAFDRLLRDLKAESGQAAEG